MPLPTMKRKIVLRQTFVMMFGLLLTAVLLPAPTLAQHFLCEYGTPREGTDDPMPPVFRVKAVKNNQIYDTVVDTNKGLSFKIKAKGRCPEDHHLSPSTIHLRGVSSGQSVIFPVNEKHRSIGGNNGQDWNQYNLDFPFLLPKLSPVETCNAELKRKQEAGQSIAGMLQKGFTVFVANSYDVLLDISCEKNVHMPYYEIPQYHAQGTLPAEIQCMPTGFVPTQGAPSKPGRHDEPAPQRTPPPPAPLTSVSIAANPAETKGRTCPAYVNFSGRITANPDSTYATFNTKYRFLGDNNYETDWLFVSVNRDEPRTVHGRRFIQAPTNDPRGTIIAPGEKPRIPIYRGWMALEVQLPNGSKRSERVSFTVDCNPVPTKPRIRTQD